MDETTIKDSYGFERGEAIYITVSDTIRIAVDWDAREHGSIDLPVTEWSKLKDRIDLLLAVREQAQNALPSLPPTKGSEG